MNFDKKPIDAKLTDEDSFLSIFFGRNSRDTKMVEIYIVEIAEPMR